MKKIYISIFTIFFSFFISKNTFAQQIPTIANFNFQPSLFNPARAGADRDFVGVVYRQQFLDLEKKYAPQTFNVNADLSKTIGLSDRVGIGFNLMTDKIHVFNRTNVNGFFAYHLTPQESEHHFSAGISAGYLSQRMDFSEVTIVDPTGADGVFASDHSKGIFDGGFGIHYRYNKVFNIDVASPQLFTSDLNYSEGTGFEQVPHLLAAMSYKIETPAVTITPNVLYNGMFGAEKNKSNIDLNVQVGFLENQFWIGGGYRLDAETFMASLGMDLNGFQLSGTYESHPSFGGTVEVAAKYSFGGTDEYIPQIIVDNSMPTTRVPEPKPTPTTPTTPSTSSNPSVENTGRSLTVLEREFTKQKYRSNNALASINRLDKEIGQSLKLAEQNLKEAQASTSQEGRLFKVKKVREYLEEIQPKVQNMNTNLSTIQNSQQEANNIITEVQQRKMKIKKSSKTLKNINKEYSSSYQKINEVDRRSEVLKINLETFEKRYGLQPVDLKQLVASQNMTGLKKYFQKELDNALVKPKNVSPIQLINGSSAVTIAYQFPSDEEQYNIEKDLNEVKMMSAHIVSKVNEIQEQGLQIESIVIRADLALSNTMLQYNKNATYDGEYGEIHSVSLKTFDKETKTSFPRKDLIIRNGNIDLEKLVGLKLYGMRKYLAQQMNTKDVLVNLELTTGNFDQRFTQLYSVEVRVKK